MLAGADIICRHVASVGRTARPAMNATGVVAEIGKLVVSGENVRQDENGASGEDGSANVSGEEADTTTANIAGDILGPAGTRGRYPAVANAITPVASFYDRLENKAVLSRILGSTPCKRFFLDP